MLFDDMAITAIHQGSGGLYRKANHLARGSLIASAKTDSASVNAENVCIAATELLYSKRLLNEFFVNHFPVFVDIIHKRRPGG
jgi:hypothetical protein